MTIEFNVPTVVRLEGLTAPATVVHVFRMVRVKREEDFRILTDYRKDGDQFDQDYSNWKEPDMMRVKSAIICVDLFHPLGNAKITRRVSASYCSVNDVDKMIAGLKLALKRNINWMSKGNRRLVWEKFLEAVKKKRITL
jgi:hypothetical protein